MTIITTISSILFNTGIIPYYRESNYPQKMHFRSFSIVLSSLFDITVYSAGNGREKVSMNEPIIAARMFGTAKYYITRNYSHVQIPIKTFHFTMVEA